MREPKFRKGDTVTFKTWEDMVSEYGDPYNVPFEFCVEMQHLCGKSFKVRSVEWSDSFQTYRIDLVCADRFNYSEEMFVDPLLLCHNDEVGSISTISLLF